MNKTTADSLNKASPKKATYLCMTKLMYPPLGYQTSPHSPFGDCLVRLIFFIVKKILIVVLRIFKDSLQKQQNKQQKQTVCKKGCRVKEGGLLLAAQKANLKGL